jgi:two-component system, sensor histidine kinase FlrB
MALAIFTNTAASGEQSLADRSVRAISAKSARELPLFPLKGKAEVADAAKAHRTDSYLQQLLQENTQLQQGLSQAQAQNQYLLQLIDVMPTGVVLLDGNGIVAKVNHIARQLLDEPILGQAWLEVIQRSFKPRADDWHEVSLKDGRRVKLDIQAIDNQPGQLITITDLTETRLLQDKLSHLQRLSSLGRMVSSLAHQIRTPLSSAILYAANLANLKLANNEKSSFQQKLMARLKDLEQQVNDMLLFAKSGEQSIVEPLSVRELVTDSVKQMDELVQQKSAQIMISGCEQDAQILGNKTALTGAMHNLIDNSLQMVSTNPVIKIALHYQHNFVYLSVKDNGQGIDEELASKIFEPFVTSRAQGTGLGLAVVKSVAQAHKGDVQLLSRAGEGAHFCIKLPIYQATHTAKNGFMVQPVSGSATQEQHHE